MTEPSKSSTDGPNTTEKLLADAEKARDSQTEPAMPIVLRETGHIEGPRPDMSQLVAQHLSALRHVEMTAFGAQDLGVPLKPPPCPFVPNPTIKKD